MKKDFYEILGLTKAATADEIKKAYRKMAVRYHPDKNKAADATEKFQEISHAYEVLSDTQKRQAYDQYGHAAFDRTSPPPQPESRRTNTQETGYGPYAYSRGNNGAEGGFGSYSDPNDVFEQFFQGASPFSTRQPRHVYTLTLDFIEAVRGVTQQVTINGKQQTIKIPAGVDTGTRVRYGDYDIVMEVLPDPSFRREGADVHTEKEITFKQAILGDIVQIKTLDGALKLRIPAGTQPGTIMRLSKRGIVQLKGKEKGDLYVQLKVTIPKMVTAQQKDVLEKF